MIRLQANCVFCTQDGAANDKYFREHFRGLNIKSKELNIRSINDQIQQVGAD